MANDRFYLGKLELTGLIRTLIRAYRFNNQNKDPEAVVLPYIDEVDGVKVEMEEPPKSKPSTAQKGEA